VLFVSVVLVLIYSFYLESGIIVFRIISGRLSKKGRLEVLLDDGYWPCMSTVKARQCKAQWDYVGEGFMKEIDFGLVWLRLNQAPEGDKDDIVAEWKGEVKPFLHASLVSFVTSTCVYY
jgi:Ca2+-dependent lipid-binding protein